MGGDGVRCARCERGKAREVTGMVVVVVLDVGGRGKVKVVVGLIDILLVLCGWIAFGAGLILICGRGICESWVA